jgi:hypothetical protein
VVRFAVDPGRTVLVSVNIQNVFVTDSLRAVPQGVQVAGRLNRLAAARRRAGIPVIWTRHVVRPEDSNTSFYGTDLEVLLRSRGIDTIILGAINTIVCVDTTAREAAVHEFRAMAALAAGRQGVLPVVQERDGSPAGMGWYLMPGVEQRALPGSFPRQKTEPGISPGRSMCWLATGRHDDAVTVAARRDRRGQMAPGQGGQNAEKHR